MATKTNKRNLAEAWERQPKETIQAYEAYSVYRDMGNQRSYAKVARELGKSLSLIEKWGKMWNWVGRTSQYEYHMDKVAMDIREETVRTMLKRHIGTSIVLQEKVEAGLKSLKASKMTPMEIVKMFELAVKVEREARGVAGVVDEVKLNLAREKLDFDKSKANLTEKMLEENSPFIQALHTLGSNVWGSEEVETFEDEGHEATDMEEDDE
jgi:hypothetical protein